MSGDLLFYVCVCVCVCVCGACVHACVRMCARACVRTCVRGHMRACVCAFLNCCCVSPWFIPTLSGMVDDIECFSLLHFSPPLTMVTIGNSVIH